MNLRRMIVKDKIYSWIEEQLSIDKLGIYEELCKQLKEEIARLNKEERAVEINRDDKIADNVFILLI